MIDSLRDVKGRRVVERACMGKVLIEGETKRKVTKRKGSSKGGMPIVTRSFTVVRKSGTFK